MTLSGIWTVSRESHPSKVFLAIAVIVFGMDIDPREIQWWNAISPMWLTLLGIEIKINERHPEKALAPISLTLSGMLILESDVHSEKWTEAFCL